MSEDDNISCCVAYLDGYMEDTFMTINATEDFENRPFYEKSFVFYEDKFAKLNSEDQIDLLYEIIHDLTDKLHDLLRQQGVVNYLENLEEGKKE